MKKFFHVFLCAASERTDRRISFDDGGAQFCFVPSDFWGYFMIAISMTWNDENILSELSGGFNKGSEFIFMTIQGFDGV